MKSWVSTSVLLAFLASSAAAQQRMDGKSPEEPIRASRGTLPAPPQPWTVPVAQAPDLLGRGINPLFGVRASDQIVDSPIRTRAIGFNNRGVFWRDGSSASGWVQDIYHQPLIQVKVRIIEVVREDTLTAKTVLDIIRDKETDSLVNHHTLNGGNEGSTTSTRFPRLGVVGTDLGGSGGIVNVTTNQLNIISEFLATEFKADLLTCPQVVTLNGQKVQLLSGANVPFQLGQSVVHDATLAVQDTFYKHVGTNLTVTPRIINWGPRGEGQGQRPVMAGDVLDWNGVARFLRDEDLYVDDDDRTFFEKYAATTVLMPVDDQRRLLNAVNQHDRASLNRLLAASMQLHLFRPLEGMIIDENGCPCDWDPAECTLDVELVLRQSNTNSSPTLDLTGDSQRASTANFTAEEIGAAIANVVQLKNGHGAVIAGLIGERDVNVSAKVPVLGDLPVIGAAFRAKSTNRQKTEIVIFLEAEILDSDPFGAVAQAADDFDLTRAYLHDDVLCNPLELGLQRAGIGSYLPPRSFDEHIYWERLGRKVQKSSTAIHDILR